MIELLEKILSECRNVISDDSASIDSKELARKIGRMIEPRGLWYVKFEVKMSDD